MNLSGLDKGSEIAPVLVRLYDSHKICGLARDKAPEARLALAQVMYDLLEMDLSEKEGLLVADILITLLRQAEKDLRCVISGHLASLPSVPLRVALQIANDEIDVAEPMLKHSPVLADLDLAYIIKANGAGHWRAIAARHDLGVQVMEMLAKTGDIETAIQLVENNKIVLSKAALGILVDIARGYDNLAQPLVMRDELTGDLAAKLYTFVGKAVQDYIVRHYQIDGLDVSRTVKKAVDNFVGEIEAGAKDMRPDQGHLNKAEALEIKGVLTIDRVISSLKNGQTRAFVAQFAQFTGLLPDVIEEVMSQVSGQGLAIISKAQGLEKQEFMSLFLLGGRLREGAGTAGGVGDITRAVSYFDRIDRDVAQKIVRQSFAGVLMKD